MIDILARHVAVMRPDAEQRGGRWSEKDRVKIVSDDLVFCILSARVRITISRGFGWLERLRVTGIHGCNSMSKNSDLHFTIFHAQLLKRVSFGRVVRPCKWERED
jgi:hypothetical protein